jgi:hypothetical protein
MGQKKKRKGSKTQRKIRHKKQIDEEFLSLDFSNISEWNAEVISNLYKKYSIVHTKMGEKFGSEKFCSTKHKPRWRYYFHDEEVDWSLGPKTKEFYFSPLRPEYGEIFLMLQESQREYRAFLEGCMADRFDLQFINERLARMPIQFTWGADNYWIPEISFTTPWLPDVESYIDWEIIRVVFAQKGPQVFGKLDKCKMCKSFFVYRRKTKIYCDDKCKAASHRMRRREDIRTYKKRRWDEGKDQ